MANEVTAPLGNSLSSAVKPLLLLFGIAGAVAAGLLVALWSRGPSYSLLYANLSAEDQAQVAQALDAAQIRYRLQPGSNAIEVVSDHLADARLKLAGQGLPEGGGGFATLDKDPGFGVSQFVESARYQHALETELARTIANLRPVEGARVHIALSRQSAFVRDHHAASASVFVQLKAGQRLEQEQVQAIINLVASSIPELDAHQVTVVDQQGRLLSQPPGHDEFSLRQEQFDLISRLEDDYRQRVEALLTPLVGAGHVRAQVVAQLDMASSEQAREQYAPGTQIVRSEQTSEQTSHDGAGTQGGVPGALSNQPPPAGVATAPPAAAAAPPAAAKPAAAGAPGGANAAAAGPGAAPATPENVSKESTRNYEIDRTLAYTHEPGGKLKRLTVAVLIDDLHGTDKAGKPQSSPLSAAQVDHITQLVKDAVGFDQARGDTVSVVNASFAAETAAPAGELQAPAIWERPLFGEMVRIVSGALVLVVLVLTVLRPLMRNLLTLPRERAALAAVSAGVAPTAQAAAGATLADPAQQLTQARSLVSQDPKRVAQVLRGWVEQDG
ncbi:MAG TPA: flagellar basal-body MS-ring/collar protein FliF [Steroidobacteraceae bacterium]|nr:flagellar basal-body MS-ring/collar protein FliF [Steroidobacteraceae bacterium]